ncbi:DNA polymerase III psi subunit [Halomonas fontilapidosi]|uniref:DNA polymerase III psi subunit n=1 Tax=Halomonas fontilapidosi TaxID=616675 RepID=A0A7W5GY09_9GAMM|nr:DNA polymerase III psi subunit [Halomonas fontilapidosi]
MTPEPQRLQYLEAMGLTAWASRYRLPNALPTPACEWETASPEAEGRRAPGERLHALLDEAAEAQVAAPRPAPAEPEPRHRPSAGKARALLGDLVPAEVKEAEHEAPRPGPVQQRGEALRFTLQVACLDGRWLLLLPGKAPPSRVELRLLRNLLRAAGVVPEQMPTFEAFRWPQVEELPVEAPLEEAREGLQAFLAGRQRRGWVPERLLVFGEDETLAELLTLSDGHCPLLALPAWQGPALGELAGSAEAKRALWPQMAGWRDAWRAGHEAD